jgi:hypothetical protein
LPRIVGVGKRSTGRKMAAAPITQTRGLALLRQGLATMCYGTCRGCDLSVASRRRPPAASGKKEAKKEWARGESSVPLTRPDSGALSQCYQNCTTQQLTCKQSCRPPRRRSPKPAISRLSWPSAARRDNERPFCELSRSQVAPRWPGPFSTKLSQIGCETRVKS